VAVICILCWCGLCFLRYAYNTPLMPAANKDTEQTSTPWCESSPDEFRYSNLMYPDHREREKDQHEKNKRWVVVCLGAFRGGQPELCSQVSAGALKPEAKKQVCSYTFTFR